MAKRQAKAPALRTINDEFNEYLHTFIINDKGMNLTLSIDLNAMTCDATLNDGVKEFKLTGKFEEVE